MSLKTDVEAALADVTKTVDQKLQDVKTLVTTTVGEVSMHWILFTVFGFACLAAGIFLGVWFK